MKTMEIEGKTIDEAIEKACREFNVAREKLNIDIISEGTSGFLGIGSKKALIKASILNFDMTFDAPPSEKPKPQKTIPVSTPVVPASKPLETGKDNGDLSEKTGLRAKEILEGILTRMDINIPVSVTENEESIKLDIEGDGGGLLIGKRGQNLDAIQYIVNKATNRSENGRKPIVIDTGAYRKRREESLVSLAMKLGDKVKKTKKAVTVSNMNAHDRRIIHLTLQNDDLLITKSRGEGEYRKIVIMTARKPRINKNPSA